VKKIVASEQLQINCDRLSSVSRCLWLIIMMIFLTHTLKLVRRNSTTKIEQTHLNTLASLSKWYKNRDRIIETERVERGREIGMTLSSEGLGRVQ